MFAAASHPSRPMAASLMPGLPRPHPPPRTILMPILILRYVVLTLRKHRIPLHLCSCKVVLRQTSLRAGRDVLCCVLCIILRPHTSQGAMMSRVRWPKEPLAAKCGCWSYDQAPWPSTTPCVRFSYYKCTLDETTSQANLCPITLLTRPGL